MLFVLSERSRVRRRDIPSNWTNEDKKLFLEIGKRMQEEAAIGYSILAHGLTTYMNAQKLHVAANSS